MFEYYKLMIHKTSLAHLNTWGGLAAKDVAPDDSTCCCTKYHLDGTICYLNVFMNVTEVIPEYFGTPSCQCQQTRHKCGSDLMLVHNFHQLALALFKQELFSSVLHHQEASFHSYLFHQSITVVIHLTYKRKEKKEHRNIPYIIIQYEMHKFILQFFVSSFETSLLAH